MATKATTRYGAERLDRSAAIGAVLDEAADVINAQHASVLSRVIEAAGANLHRDVDGFSAVREWLVERFDFHKSVAADVAAIARNHRKFIHLTEAACAGTARIDQVAYAVRQLAKTAAMGLYARTPYREPVPSPWEAAEMCATPEELVAQYCIHAPFSELAAHLGELAAALAGEAELFEGLSEASLQRLELWEQDNGMWHLDADLTADTGLLFAKLLKTAVPPPRHDDADTDGVLPAQAGRNAEALHHMLAVYGADPAAATRHGHTATLSLSVDIDTLQGKDTGRVPQLEGRAVSVAKARLLACEASVLPSVFDYGAGETVELGRSKRLPTPALRRKLELEQPGGCAWSGCGRPVAWTEAHHIVHWADGGTTDAANLILLCRFHHGRIHTAGWSVTKTGPGTALITHHQGHDPAHGDGACGCSDWRSDRDLESAFEHDVANAFTTGLYPEEWAPALKGELAVVAQQHEFDSIIEQARKARAKARARFTTPAPDSPMPPTRGQPAEPDLVGPRRVLASVGSPDLGPPPF